MRGSINSLLNQMVEKGAYTIASYYGAPHGLGASSPWGWCYRRRRPLFGLLLLLIVSVCEVEPLPAQTVGGVRVGVLTGPESGQPYLLVEYRGPEPVGIERGAPLILSANTIIHANAVAVGTVEQKCDPGCLFFERALFHVGREDLSSLAQSATAVLVVLSARGPLVGRLEFDHLAPIRRYVQQHDPPRQALPQT